LRCFPLKQVFFFPFFARAGAKFPIACHRGTYFAFFFLTAKQQTGLRQQNSELGI